MDLHKLVRPNILALKPYSSARNEFSGEAEVFLDANENPYNTGLNRYPDPLQWEVKRKLGRLKGVAPERIFLGNGSDEVIDLLVRIFCKPGADRIVILPPTYGMYRVCADICGVAVTQIPLAAQFQPDVAAILADADEHSKLLFLCSPNNPTGNIFDATRIEALLQGFPGIVVIDEAYIDFAANPGCLGWLDSYDNLVVMQTFSKAWGLAGIRLGMAFAGEAIIALMNKVKPPYNINQLTQEAVLRALDNEAQQQLWVASLLSQRVLLQQFLAGFDFVTRIYPSEANFLLVKVTDPKGLYAYMVAQKIIVRDRSTVILCEGCLRITVGAPEENERLVQALVAYDNG